MVHTAFNDAGAKVHNPHLKKKLFSLKAEPTANIFSAPRNTNRGKRYNKRIMNDKNKLKK
ncbi:hypothetical protein DRF67_20080 [Chryseobacterium pennipullorum]|uniref:Uncharacterized protein n=1 Tax=Chryseobacterium pennipullorum TaxID=2258963 RepID=A0A3D9ANI7_9FLAO|nr:hypothetical protein DRF67_20080 [Chryseobacterium pennipullorum]